MTWGYGKDKNKVYYQESVLEGARPETFTYDEKRRGWTDGKTIYRGGNAVEK